ncbi:unnamed protein product [Allacma fusca]|uniref:Uncharacterized protein n=1 Tax=Allacma fusca TaxID=39272 RepID=A0A8J2KV49_9HEXA|nr:unnamed protein product [Allacma fusca]
MASNGLTIAQPLAEIAKIHNLNNPYGERDVTLTHEDIETRKTALITVIVITVLRICLAFESFLMGIVLLGGSLYRNTRDNLFLGF